MSATRTQVYLTADQRARIDELVDREGVTVAEVVRRALDAYVDDYLPDPAPALAATFGAAPEFRVPDRVDVTRN